MDEEYERRKGLTFAQAEGIEPLPAQLDRSSVTPKLRALLWQVLHSHIANATYQGEIREPWSAIFYDFHVQYLFRMADEFSSWEHSLLKSVKPIFLRGDAAAIYGTVQFVIRHPKAPSRVKTEFEDALAKCQSPYRMVGGDTLVPLGSEEEAKSVRNALSVTGSSTGFEGPHAHLRAASSALADGSFADCVRESIHAVEGAARLIAGTSDLAAALTLLEKSAGMHSAMKRGFGALYGYTSDEKGIRHALLEGGDAKVDEADAMFMLGACSAFVSNLIAKGRAAGLLRPS